MRLLGYSGWLLGCCKAVAMVTRVIARVLLGYSGWLLGCCHAVARVLVVVAKVPGVVARVLLGGFYGNQGDC